MNAGTRQAEDRPANRVTQRMHVAVYRYCKLPGRDMTKSTALQQEETRVLDVSLIPYLPIQYFDIRAPHYKRPFPDWLLHGGAHESGNSR